MSTELKTGVTRRDVLKKGAVAGAVAWSVPLITSSPAFAATGECSGSTPCQNWYYIKVGEDGLEGGTADGGGTGCNEALPSNPFGCPAGSASVSSGGLSQGVTGSFNAGTATATFTLPAGVIPLYVQPKPASSCYTYEYDAGSNSFVPLNGAPDGVVSVNGNPSTGMTITMTIATLSHANLYFCK